MNNSIRQSLPLWLTLVVLSAVVGLVSAATAAPSFKGLGFLPGGENYSIANAVSANGSVVVGNGRSSSSGEERAFRWTSSGGMVGLADMNSTAVGVSADGTVVAGTVWSDLVTFRAFRWTSGGGMTGLGLLPDGRYTQAHAISADGSVVVGDGYGEERNDEGFRWTSSGGMESLENRPEPYIGYYDESEANGVSADGSVVVGRADVILPNDTHYEAYRWTSGTGIVTLGNPPGTTTSSAHAVSANGTVIVGQRATPNRIGGEAFRWTSSGGMESLDNRPGAEYFGSDALGVSADGSTVVGRAHFDAGYRAYRWTEGKGMQSVSELLTSSGIDMTGWLLTHATAISANGRTIVGNGINPDGDHEAWIATFGGATVRLAWGEAAPFQVVYKTGFFDTFHEKVAGQTAAAAVPANVQALIAEKVQSIFDVAGVNVHVASTATSETPSTTVFIGSHIQSPSLLGKAVSGIDHFNAHSDDQAIVYVSNSAYDFSLNSWLSFDIDNFAGLIAHEVGHTFGLVHVCGNQDVMSQGGASLFNTRFVNAAYKLSDNPVAGQFRQNTVYSLRRYVNGESNAALEAAGIHPGGWDIGKNVIASLLFSSDATLYDVHLLSDDSSSDGSLQTIAHFDSITLQELSALKLPLTPGSHFALSAASQSGGALDVVLATGDPFVSDNLAVVVGPGTYNIALQMADPQDATKYITLSSGAINVAAVFGDVNRDGVVNIFDVNLVSSRWGELGPTGDANGDMAVNIFDINLISSNWTPTGSSAVPEPATWGLALFAAIALLPRLRHAGRAKK